MSRLARWGPRTAGHERHEWHKWHEWNQWDEWNEWNQRHQWHECNGDVAAVCSTLFPSSSTAVCAASLGFYKMVFVTKGSFDGNLGGTAGAAAICQTDADAAGLPGKYRAWLSTTLTYGGDAALQDEPLNTFTHSTVPYYEPDGTTEIATNWSTFATASPSTAIAQHANGTTESYSSSPFVWTGTTYSGTYSNDFAGDCNSWTDNTGSYGGDGGEPTNNFPTYWTSIAPDSAEACNVPAHLYCVQQ